MTWQPTLRETGRWPLYDSWVRYVNEGLRRLHERRAQSQDKKPD